MRVIWSVWTIVFGEILNPLLRHKVEYLRSFTDVHVPDTMCCFGIIVDIQTSYDESSEQRQSSLLVPKYETQMHSRFLPYSRQE
jgi:hypothetical protein